MEVNTTSVIDLSRYDAPIVAHVICIIAIIATGGTGNSVVLYIYNQKMKKGNIFIQILAFLDLTCILTITPQFAFMKQYYIMKAHGNTLPMNIYIAWMIFNFLIQGLALICIAIDRMVAVVSPLSYQTLHKRMVKMYAGTVVYSSHLAVIIFVLDSNDSRQRTFLGLYMGMHFFLFFATLIVSYSVIIYKIRRQRIKVTALTMNMTRMDRRSKIQSEGMKTQTETNTKTR